MLFSLPTASFTFKGSSNFDVTPVSLSIEEHIVLLGLLTVLPLLDNTSKTSPCGLARFASVSNKKTQAYYGSASDHLGCPMVYLRLSRTSRNTPSLCTHAQIPPLIAVCVYSSPEAA